MILMRVLVAFGLAVSLAGCAAFSDDSPTSGGGLQVVAAFYPLQYVTQRVAGDHVDVTDLTQPGAEPHDLELSPAQTAQVVDADLIVYERGLQAAVDDAVAQDGGGATVDAGAVAGLEPIGHDGHDDATHDQGGTEESESGDLGDLDPHFWQDPLKLAKVADAVADALAKVDPAHAADYHDNAAALGEDLAALDGEYSSGLDDCQRDTIVVSHNAFGYLGRYGLYVEPISGLSPDAEPTPADLARLQQLIEEKGITTVFSERLVSQRLSQTLADDMGITTAVLDPIEGLSDETADEDYLSLMRENLSALELANGCP
jgi:zinc transport system substrate-binding protein